MRSTFLRASTAVLMLGTSAIAAAQSAPIVQPGAPGQAPKTLTSDEATKLADNRYSPDDVVFMQGMIHHHYQAVQMAALVEDRTNTPELVALAKKIGSSQDDEIAFMAGWLTERGEMAPDPAEHAKHAAMGHSMPMAGMDDMEMAGMATPEQMAALAQASGTEFDRQFLTLMIAHHDGALEMVKDLLAQPGSAYDPILFDFTNDVKTDQEAEIEQMNGLLAGLSSDPRANLAAGFRDAGEAISGLRKLASLPKPAGFFDPANPAGLAPPKPVKDKSTEDGEDSAEQDDAGDSKTRFSERSPLLNFANTDIAFSGDMLVAGNYHGFNIYQLDDGGLPNLLSSVVCPGGQGDISIAGDLLVMSVEQTRGRTDCGLQGISEKISEERFRGLRIFDISDLTAPRQVGQVQTCRGSHTHSIVSETADTLLVYNSGTSGVRDEKELAGCIGNVAGDDRTALFSIDVIEIPVTNPAAAKIVDSPRVFADPETGQIAGLWRGGDHGDGTQDTRETNQCHDITAYPALGLAAGACSGNGILLDISDPRAPKRIDAVTDKGFAYWHSATFSNDGTKVLFTDEWGGGGRPRCQASDPRDWGANAIYEVVDGKLEFRSTYKLPAPQGEKENCVAHNGSIIPVPGRDIFVQAWYQGGISVIDFTDAANPVEIAFFDRGPIDEEQLVTGGYWSAYWYNGRIYGTEIVRGLDVFALEPSEFLTAEEIAAAEAASMGATFNPQTQTRVTWDEDIKAAAEASRKGG